jgi:hypothetical protein
VIGCLNNGSTHYCKNNSTCNYDGICQCKNGYSGLYCDQTNRKSIWLGNQ